MRVSEGKYIILANGPTEHMFVSFDQSDHYITIRQGDDRILVPYGFVQTVSDAIRAATYEATGTSASDHEKNRRESEGHEQPDDSH